MRTTMELGNYTVKTRILFTVAIALGLLACLGCQFDPSDGSRDGLIKLEPISQDIITSILAKHQVPGVSIAVIQGGKLVWSKGYGLRLVNTDQQVTSSTIFQAASLSKPVTSAAVLRQVAKGTLSLDEPLDFKLPSELQSESGVIESTPMTLHHLLSHTAGLTVHGFPGYSSKADLPNLQEIIDGNGSSITEPIRVEREPGSGFSYSGGGYVLIQHFMTGKTKIPFPVIMKQLVLSPVGMRDSTFLQPLPQDRRSNVAAGHIIGGDPLPGMFLVFPEMAAAGLWTTPTDYARFICELWRSYQGLSDTFLPQPLTRKMLTRIHGEWGLGVWLPREGEFRFQHGGRNEGFHSFFMMTIGSGNGMVILTNGESGDKVIEEVYDLVVSTYGWGDPEVRITL